MTVWSALDSRKRLFVALATAAVFVAVMMLAKNTASRDMSLLFGGLDPTAAGEVVKSLDQTGAIYEIRGTSIYVENSQRDALRMTLAGEGLPASGSQGYELLDGLSGFGTTSQMFDAAYWRAKEGELARTILASPLIRTARVHISTPSTRSFQRDQKPTAAVNITTNGRALSARHVKALQYLVGAAVQGLDPSSVAIIDGNSGLISDTAGIGGIAGGDERAEELRVRAERLLAAHVGAQNAVVEVSIETVTETEHITERTFDPSARVAISTDVSETTAKSQDSGGSNVTVASNLPAGAAAGGSGTSNNENSESRALTNYEVNETQRQLTRTPGDVRRLTVAVLINDIVSIDANGVQTTTQRTPEELASLQALVSSAVGFDASRGDEITLRSMPFQPIAEVGTDGVAGVSTPLNMMKLIQISALAIVSLVLGLFVVRPILAPNRLPAVLPTTQTPSILQDATQAPLAITAQTAASKSGSSSAGSGAGSEPQSGEADPVTRLRKMISERETETIQILQDWMEQPEEPESA
jgi:flagellar M-ring protein FliF